MSADLNRARRRVLIHMMTHSEKNQGKTHVKRVCCRFREMQNNKKRIYSMAVYYKRLRQKIPTSTSPPPTHIDQPYDDVSEQVT